MDVEMEADFYRKWEKYLRKLPLISRYTKLNYFLTQECLTLLSEKSNNCPAVHSRAANSDIPSNTDILSLYRGIEPNHTEIPTLHHHLYLHLHMKIHKDVEICYIFISKPADRHILHFILGSSSFPLSYQ